MELFNFVLPKSSICKEESLYFRLDSSPSVDNSAIYDEEIYAIRLRKGATVSFDTYFNCFSYSKYLKYTWLSSVGILLLLEGQFIVRLIATKLIENNLFNEVLQEHFVHFVGMNEFVMTQNFEIDNSKGFYYIELTALSNDAKFYGGRYFVDEVGQQLNMVKIALILCTYMREEFVYRNIVNINTRIFNNITSSVRSDMDLYIIDNGNTVDSTLVESKYIKLLRNRNCGGSGGFARGIIESCKQGDKYTHVLLMDDDIVFESEILVKVINFIKVLKFDYYDACLGAGMIRKDQPYLQHESGVYWNGKYPERKKANIDLRLKENLLFNEIEELVNYSGWWFMCIPLRLIKEKNLPLPFFIKADDIEYGIRLSTEIILMNGIGIWHEHFNSKHSVHLEYYIKRNETILAAIHYPHLGAIASIKKLLFSVGKQQLRMKYSAHYFLFRAYDDFLKGVDFLFQTDAEKLNSHLLKKSKQPSKDGSIIYFPIMLIIIIFSFLLMSIKLLYGYKKAAITYRERMKDVTSLNFWYHYLQLEEENSYVKDAVD